MAEREAFARVTAEAGPAVAAESNEGKHGATELAVEKTKSVHGGTIQAIVK